MPTLLEATKELFRSVGWQHEAAANQPIVRAKYKGDRGEWLVYAFADDPHHQLVVFSVHPTKAPPEKRSALAELFMRINFELPVGGFELDFRDGTMRFRTAFDFEDVAVTALMARNLVLPNVAAMNKFYEAIEKVLQGTSPERAV
jgi:hypothetical protein